MAFSGLIGAIEFFQIGVREDGHFQSPAAIIVAERSLINLVGTGEQVIELLVVINRQSQTLQDDGLLESGEDLVAVGEGRLGGLHRLVAFTSHVNGDGSVEVFPSIFGVLQSDGASQGLRFGAGVLAPALAVVLGHICGGVDGDLIGPSVLSAAGDFLGQSVAVGQQAIGLVGVLVGIGGTLDDDLAVQQVLDLG